MNRIQKRPSLLAVVLAAACVTMPGPVRAEEDAVGDLANAICAAPDVNSVISALSAFGSDESFGPESVAEAFGIATFLSDLGRCASRQAIADSFAYYKKGKEVAKLDAAFALGRVAAKPGAATEGGGEDVYQGSFAALGTAGDAPSGQ
ncbi:MAG: hypothetical protein ABL996_17655 [Micropepsaceae bacterium]